MSLPTRKDFGPLDDLDAKSAFDTFFGKDLQQAKKVFAGIATCCLEELTPMGIGAFRYYVLAAIAAH